MPYIDGSQIDPAIRAQEIDLLTRGFSYSEIAAMTKERRWTISERNRLVYKIDIWQAFRYRIARDGVPCRLKAPDSFCYWFSGFFDGEGTITIFSRPASRRPQYAEFRLSIRIMIRDDDARAITRIQDNLQVGRIQRCPKNGRINPTIAWSCERIADLAEVILPLFDRYPLYTKKAKEYAIWRPIVMQRYITTIGGYSNRSGIPIDERREFLNAIEAITDIRRYRAVA